MKIVDIADLKAGVFYLIYDKDADKRVDESGMKLMYIFHAKSDIFNDSGMMNIYSRVYFSASSRSFGILDIKDPDDYDGALGFSDGDTSIFFELEDLEVYLHTLSHL